MEEPKNENEPLKEMAEEEPPKEFAEIETEAEAGPSKEEEDLTKEKAEKEAEVEVEAVAAPACVPCVEVQNNPTSSFPPAVTPPPFKRARVGLQYKTKGLIVREETYDEDGFPVSLCRCAGVHPTKEGWCRNEDHHFGRNCNNIIDAKNGERRCTLCERGCKAKFKPKRLSSAAEPSLETSIFCQDIMQAAQEIVDTAYRLAKRMEQGRLRQTETKSTLEKPLEGRTATLRSAAPLVEEIRPEEE
jgi:hypothetical protein